MRDSHIRNVYIDIIWIISLVLLVYFVTAILISAIRTLMTRRNKKSFAKETFREIFWDFFFEMINPFN